MQTLIQYLNEMERDIYKRGREAIVDLNFDKSDRLLIEAKFLGKLTSLLEHHFPDAMVIIKK